ncbi:hydroxyacylglutathione hydrolase [Marinimicrobium sp. ABcell2]|uniref:hydroxyacylglutathione hydrolase n=1 Tax=Marinimicrobium sp. ABcell2 TaxID=3069751 RepID=UPI0027B54DF9|nr:hydroxyacylglutathione hydrolase [Marinimicrobium sp. ABcell2]MDQ2075704.1 hydroxyacylglutathione hydrolase [Marinimicrobium sp. ABcell2]
MFDIEAIPTLDTNYVWLLKGTDRRAYIVDPGEAAPVIERLQEGQLTLAGVLITHHHWDHTDGLDDLLAYSQVPVYGPSSVRQVSEPLSEGEHLTLEHVTFEVIALPGHTLDHIAYYSPAGANQPPVVFCGDALFAGGCGRLFEGTAEQALHSLKKLTQLPPDTLVYCAHEYTLANLRFARLADPDNPALESRRGREERALARTGITLPTVMSEELATNPFLRCREPAIRKQVEAHAGRELKTEADVFAALRSWKDAN